jgi:hypothetical protein
VEQKEQYLLKISIKGIYRVYIAFIGGLYGNSVPFVPFVPPGKNNEKRNLAVYVSKKDLKW